MKDRYERRAYRKSPGREYGYDYDPLHSKARSRPWASDQETTSQGAGRSTVQLAPRPDPRRTRQLLRQSILASKHHSTPLDETHVEQRDVDRSQAFRSAGTRARHTPADEDTDMDEGQEDSTLYSNRYRVRRNRSARPQAPVQQFSEPEPQVDEGEWNEFDFVDPDIGYEDPSDRRSAYAQTPSIRSPAPRSSALSRRNRQPAYDEDQYDEYYEEEEQAPQRRQPKKRSFSRRALFVGLGLAAGGIAAYELAPRIPQAIHDVGNDIEHQIQDAYNRGLTAGANAVRKEFINSLENLEGISLDAAMTSTVLLRRAYDTFVSPLVTLAATVTGDFLNITLSALKSARGFLFKFNQDNDTLAALQTVLETWIKQVTKMPKDIQAITAADLDGAQAYLRGVQHKIQEEQAKLNGQFTPTPQPTPKKK